jgi:hypothetical protein
MAGILANSASVTMTAGDTAADNSRAGYVVNEQITLSVTPTGTTYVWGLSKPSGATSRSDLSDNSSASIEFVPDFAGTWTVTCIVDGATTYVLRLTATAVAITSVANAHRFSPTTNTSIPAPATGLTLFCSSDASNKLRVKNTSGTVLPLDAASARTGTFVLVAGSATVADTSVTATTTVVANCTTASNQGLLRYTFTPGVGFVVTSANMADTSSYRYALLG